MIPFCPFCLMLLITWKWCLSPRIHQRNWGLWITTPSTNKMSPTFQQNVTMTFYFISHLCANQHGIWVKYRVWLGSMMAMLNARWKWPTLKMIWMCFQNNKCLDNLHGQNDIVMNLFIVELVMKYLKEVIPFSFMSQVNTLWTLCFAQLFANYVLMFHFACMFTNVIFTKFIVHKFDKLTRASINLGNHVHHF
jgi:hypothetical protein